MDKEYLTTGFEKFRYICWIFSMMALNFFLSIFFYFDFYKFQSITKKQKTIIVLWQLLIVCFLIFLWKSTKFLFFLYSLDLYSLNTIILGICCVCIWFSGYYLCLYIDQSKDKVKNWNTSITFSMTSILIIMIHSYVTLQNKYAVIGCSPKLFGPVKQYNKIIVT